jgi:hypothetical protein
MHVVKLDFIRKHTYVKYILKFNYPNIILSLKIVY